jgi:integrase
VQTVRAICYPFITHLLAQAETCRELADRYIEEYAKPNKRSWWRDKETLERDVLPVIGRLKANKVTRADVKVILHGIVNRGAPVMANRTMEVIRRVLNWAIAEEIAQVEANPCLRMPPPGGRKTSRERALSDREVKTFWKKVDGAGITPTLKLALKFILVTAQRKGEVAGARWDEVNDRQFWTVPAGRSKNGLAHRVPLSDLAVRLLEEAWELAGKSVFVFPSSLGNRPISAGGLNNAVHRMREVFGIAAFTPHDLRRTAATQMASMGIPRLTISKVLNHVDEGVTSVYDRYAYDAEKRQALDDWASRLSAIAGIANCQGQQALRPDESERLFRQ